MLSLLEAAAGQSPAPQHPVITLSALLRDECSTRHDETRARLADMDQSNADSRVRVSGRRKMVG